MNTITCTDQVREDVWYIMSDLFLDTELLERDIAYLANELAASPYSLDELNCIYEDEVAPVLHGNLKQVAGIWGTFSRDEIIPKIRRQAASHKGQRKKGIAIIEEIKRAYVLGETIDEWKRVLACIRHIRAGECWVPDCSAVQTLTSDEQHHSHNPQ